MNHRAAVFISLACAGLWSSAARQAAQATPIVSNFSPTSGPAGTVINVNGSGFTGTTKVYFEPDNNLNSALFTVISDSLLQVTVPTRDINDPVLQSFFVQAGNTGTLALSSSADQITSNGSYLGGTHYAVVYSGVTYSGNGGHGLIYVQSGGTFSYGGGGHATIVVEFGGAATAAGGFFPGGRVFAETGSTTSSGVFATLSDVSLSVVPSFYQYTTNPVPEPSSWLLMASAGAGMIWFAGSPKRSN